jgi:hypothetical protein
MSSSESLKLAVRLLRWMPAENYPPWFPKDFTPCSHPSSSAPSTGVMLYLILAGLVGNIWVALGKNLVSWRWLHRLTLYRTWLAQESFSSTTGKYNFLRWSIVQPNGYSGYRESRRPLRKCNQRLRPMLSLVHCICQSWCTKPTKEICPRTRVLVTHIRYED